MPTVVATIVLRGERLRRVIEAGLKSCESEWIDQTKEVKVRMSDSVTVTAHRIIHDGENKKLDGEVCETVTVSEPDLNCGDVVIVSPCNDFGRTLVSQYGNAWKVVSGRSSKGSSHPHTWIVTSMPAKKAGKFCGKDKKHIAQERLPVEQSHPERWARIVFVSKFPDEFKWRHYYDSLASKDVSIEQLNAVNFTKK